jgi:hypothetical protein
MSVFRWGKTGSCASSNMNRYWICPLYFISRMEFQLENVCGRMPLVGRMTAMPGRVEEGGGVGGRRLVLPFADVASLGDDSGVFRELYGVFKRWISRLLMTPERNHKEPRSRQGMRAWYWKMITRGFEFRADKRAQMASSSCWIPVCRCI